MPKPLSFKDLIVGSPLEEPYNRFRSNKEKPGFSRVSCIPGCTLTFDTAYNYEKHVEKCHPAEFMRCFTRSFPTNATDVNFNSDDDTPMDVDIESTFENDTNSLVTVENVIEPSETEQVELPIDDVETEEDFYVSSDLFSDSEDTFDLFLDKLKRSVSSTDLEFAQNVFEAIMESRISTNASLAALKRISSILISAIFKHKLFKSKTNLKEKILTFVESDHYQNSYIKSQEVPFIEPIPITCNNRIIGQYVSFKKQAALILKNTSVVKNILDEEKEEPDLGEIKVYNSELTCAPKRRKRILANLRTQSGIDDFTVTNFKSKFLIGYCSFTNIPIEQRLKRKDIFLVFVASRQEMKEAKASINDVLAPFVRDLKELAEQGFPITIHTPTATIPKTIKVVLSTLVADNLGEYELLSLKTAFYTGFICRECGCTHKIMQNKLKVSDFKLFGTETDILEYKEDVIKAKDLIKKRELAEIENGKPLSRYMLNKHYKMNSKFGVVNECIFTQIADIDIFTIGPPDELHDLAMGVVPRLNDVSLRNCVHSLSLEEIKKRIENFPFFNGRFKVSIVTRHKKKRFQFHAKAVQNMEFLSRFEEIFYHNLDRSSSNIGYRLFRALHNFCAIATSETILKEDLDKLDRNAEYLLAACKELEEDGKLDELEAVEEEDSEEDYLQPEMFDVIAFDDVTMITNETEEHNSELDVIDLDYEENKKKRKRFAIFSKLHNLLHYSDLTRLYGPLIFCSSLMYERKHVFFKNLATVMRNFRNPCYTFSFRHQISIVLWLKNSDFLRVNFFDSARRPYQGKITSILYQIDSKSTRSNMFQIYNSNKCLLQKLNIPRVEYYMHTKEYYRDPSGVIFACGFVFKLKPNTKRDLGMIDTARKCKQELLELYSQKEVYVDIRILHHRHHFWKFYQEEELHVLFRGLM